MITLILKYKCGLLKPDLLNGCSCEPSTADLTLSILPSGV